MVEVSIHAPVKGATSGFGATLRMAGGFNPRTREGCDFARQYCPRKQQLVSIHAPVKGATGGEPSNIRNSRGFNPRTREGCDCSLPVIERRLRCFNPRTREGCD